MLNYKKRKNVSLFENIQSNEKLQISKIQNFIPIYKRFFSLNETNFNSINLNHQWYLHQILNKKHEGDSTFNCEVKHLLYDSQKMKVKTFVKMAPLLEPYKYLVGKYDHNNTNLFNLPILLNSSKVHEKIEDMNNSSYIDSFFCYLSSQLLNMHGIVNCIDFYGSFLALKNKYKINIIDDIECLVESDFFNENQNKLFEIEDYSHLIYKPILAPIKIFEENENINLEFDDFIDNDINDSTVNYTEDINNKTFNEILEQPLTEENLNQNDLLLNRTINSSNSGSSCSSRTSHSNSKDYEILSESNDDETDENTSENSLPNIDNDGVNGFIDSNNKCNNSRTNSDKSNSSYSNTFSSIEEEQLFVTFNEFPIQLIFLEFCEGTLDELIQNEELEDEELFAALMQIIMTLLIYQKTFYLTHNDLHTNNVMYIKTNIKFIYYIYDGNTYKVPTFGKIYKIIDFGRAIYKFNGQLICSDSFKNGNDAATQYNIEPYYNPNKPRLEPNFSFDICRLACSIFDYYVDDINEVKDLSQCKPIVKLITEWCTDDKGVNILYKNTGVERYPDFKLYKMIARLVHIHTPQAQLERPEFRKYLLSKNVKLNSSEKIINIDKLPSYINPL